MSRVTSFDLVSEFHEKFDAPIADNPQIPPADRCELRKKLLREEVEEFCDALDEGDLVHAAKELGDICYVMHGAGIEMGVNPDDIMVIVHENNMTKVHPDGTVHRREDGKILKPDTFVPLTDDEIDHRIWTQWAR